MIDHEAKSAKVCAFDPFVIHLLVIREVPSGPSIEGRPSISVMTKAAVCCIAYIVQYSAGTMGIGAVFQGIGDSQFTKGFSLEEKSTKAFTGEDVAVYISESPYCAA